MAHHGAPSPSNPFCAIQNGSTRINNVVLISNAMHKIIRHLCVSTFLKQDLRRVANYSSINISNYVRVSNASRCTNIAMHEHRKTHVPKSHWGILLQIQRYILQKNSLQISKLLDVVEKFGCMQESRAPAVKKS